MSSLKRFFGGDGKNGETIICIFGAVLTCLSSRALCCKDHLLSGSLHSDTNVGNFRDFQVEKRFLDSLCNSNIGKTIQFC